MYTVAISDGRASDHLLAGGKGASLNYLMSVGQRVPIGFIVTQNAFSDFLQENGISLRVTEEANLYAIRNRILAGKLSETFLSELEDALKSINKSLLSVRSSAAFEDSIEMSWAGQFDTFLSVKKEEVASSIKKCWSSLFSDRAFHYGLLELLEKQHSLLFSVVVQEMILADISGVVFSTHPLKENRLLIEYGTGPGGVVSGGDTIKVIILDRKDCLPVSKVDDTSGIPPEKVTELAETALKLEEMQHRPLDIEWGLKEGKLFLFQMRPITSLQSKEHKIIDIEEYELTFKVIGLTFLFTDMLADGFAYLQPLFTSNEKGNFLQYFPNKIMHYAHDFGLAMLASTDRLDSYISEFTKFKDVSFVELKSRLKKEELEKKDVSFFFDSMSKFMEYYSKTDNEFTDKAYKYKSTNQAINTNIETLSKFKDVARAWVNQLLIENDNIYSKLISTLSKQFNKAPEEIELYSVKEILNMFESLQPNRLEIANRQIAFCIYFADEKKKYITGTDASRLISDIALTEAHSKSSAIRGNVANYTEPIVQGEAFVIHVNYFDIDAMNKQMAEMPTGAILVADFTAPELLMACKKAKAIVTDIGGLLSHAAIVSREFGVPCLVGTGDATKRIKTGDRVEINFDHGIIANHSQNDN